MDDKEILIKKLNSCDMDERLDSLEKLYKNFDIRGKVNRAYVNNHIHTTYSFSPYSPTKAVYMAYISGLETAGIMDHDSISGALEFISAGRIVGLPTTIGVETRVNFANTPFSKKLINNPDQAGIAYMALHGVPHGSIEKTDAFFANVRQKRNERNRRMCDKLALILAGEGMTFDFDKDVTEYSNISEGGSVTERTICYAVAQKILERYKKGAAVIDFLEKGLELKLGDSLIEKLSDADNVHYEYDLTGLLKSGLVKSFYIPADLECPDIDTFASLGKEVGAVSAYAYLGDVTESVTGDKKAQKFEDDYIEELFGFLKEKKINAITYMPSRNSGKQLETLRHLCGKYEFFEISGEDINSSRQRFVCPQLLQPEFAHLIQATWALIGHEKAASSHLNNGMFTEKTLKRLPALADRIKEFSAIK